jgi:hypothetical protein
MGSEGTTIAQAHLLERFFSCLKPFLPTLGDFCDFCRFSVIFYLIEDFLERVGGTTFLAERQNAMYCYSQLDCANAIFAFGRLQSSLPKALESLFDPFRVRPPNPPTDPLAIK